MKWTQRARVSKLLDSCRNKDIGKFKFSSANTEIHELAKYFKYTELKKQDIEVVVEGIFSNNKGRADVIDLDNGIAFEIVNTESEGSIILKRNKYPIPIEVIQSKEYVKTKLNEFVKKYNLWI